jgi:hypothetical protein
MDSNKILDVMFHASELSRASLLAFHMNGLSEQRERYYTQKMHEEFASVAAYFGYRIEKIEPAPVAEPAAETEAA